MSQNFNVGGVPLNPQKITKPFLREMYKAAQSAETAEGKQEALSAIESLGKTGEMSTEEFGALDSFRKNVSGEYRKDKDEMWKVWRENGRNWKDPKISGIKKEMGVSGEFLSKDQTFQTELREATARSAVAAIAGGSFGPTGTVAGYAAYANGRTWDGSAQRETEKLVATYKDYLSGDSRMISEGNKVQQVHRAELWKTLNDMTSEAAESGKAGNPVPITAQYYELTSPEMIGNLASAAKSGSPLRVNLDPGRLSYPSKDKKTGNKYYEVDDIPHKMRTVLQFANIKGADVGVSIFPMKQELGDPTDLMHRKVLRVGDKVLMSGMNANMGSGENIDAGYILEGPAARQYTENVARDIKTSTGAGMEEIWGEKHTELFHSEDLRMGRRGITAMLDALSGPTEAGAELPKPKDLKELEKLAKDAGHNLKDLVDVSADDYQKVMGDIVQGKGQISLSGKGKEALVGLLEKAVSATQTAKNKKALGDISLPSGEKVGKTRVDIADLPSEREVLTIQAIDEAEEFIYVPGFVVTRAIAGAIVAKQEQAKADGKPLDIRVVADSGVYPDGGTPNSWGVNFLEDNGVPVRWSKLTRTDWHDRKIHAKQLLTDKGEIAGSTNFSKKGMRENWETSAYVHFEKGDKQATELREQSKAQFEELWNDSTYDLSVKDLARYQTRFDPKVGREWAADQDRDYATKRVIGAIETYEVETATMMEKLLSDNSAVQGRRDELLAAGYSEGDSALKAAEEVLGREAFLKMKHDLPAHKNLEKMKSQVEQWKEKYGGE
ncbi:MAG: phospholipase D family protein [Vulcanimicrobiota bacterium]